MARLRGLSAEGSEYGEQRSLAFNVHACRVAVDVSTGTVRILQSVQAADAGTVMQSGAVPRPGRGRRRAGHRQRALRRGDDDDGRCDPNPVVPARTACRRSPTSRVTEVYFADTADELGPFGAKSMSEAPYNPVAPAIGNAIARALGSRPYELPFSRDRVWRLAAER